MDLCRENADENSGLLIQHFSYVPQSAAAARAAAAAPVTGRAPGSSAAQLATLRGGAAAAASSWAPGGELAGVMDILRARPEFAGLSEASQKRWVLARRYCGLDQAAPPPADNVVLDGPGWPHELTSLKMPITSARARPAALPCVPCALRAWNMLTTRTAEAGMR